MKKFSLLLCIVLIFSLLLTACGEENPPVVDPDDGVVDTNPGGDGNTNDGDKTPGDGTITPPTYSLDNIPAWDGKSEYVEINNNVPFFTDEDTSTSYEFYGELDSLGRCTVAIACIGIDLMPTGDRGSLSYEPTGWVQATYSCVPGSLYNRCHLIAFSLTGENNNNQNLITGTRFMNEAMIPFEEQTAAYIKAANSDRVLYRVTPIFEGDNLLANGVLMEAMSVSDHGESLQFCVYFYNCQPQITIDYATGESEGPEEEIPQEVIYILYTKKGKEKYHSPDCKSAASIAEANKAYFSGTYEEFQALVAAGYVPAGCCNPAPMTPPTAYYLIPAWVEDYMVLCVSKAGYGDA